MPADNVTTLFDFERHIEGGVEAILDSNLLVNGITIEKARGSREVLTPRIDVVLIMGPALEHRFPYKGELVQDAYQAKLRTTIVTERLRNNDTHGSIRSQLRYFMQTKLAKLTVPTGRETTAPALPYHALARISELGTTPRHDDKENLDYSDLLFELLISIRSDAWPL